MIFAGITTAFGLGFVYFIAAVPAAVAAGAPVWAAALAAWSGYAAGAGVVIAAGAPLRAWLVRKLSIPVQRDPSRMIWRVWDRWGLAGLGLLAPVTIGPQAGAVLALAIGEKAPAVFAALALGALPWAISFAALTSLGFKLAG